MVYWISMGSRRTEGTPRWNPGLFIQSTLILNQFCLQNSNFECRGGPSVSERKTERNDKLKRKCLCSMDNGDYSLIKAFMGKSTSFVHDWTQFCAFTNTYTIKIISYLSLRWFIQCFWYFVKRLNDNLNMFCFELLTRLQCGLYTMIITLTITSYLRV